MPLDFFITITIWDISNACDKTAFAKILVDDATGTTRLSGARQLEPLISVLTNNYNRYLSRFHSFPVCAEVTFICIQFKFTVQIL